MASGSKRQCLQTVNLHAALLVLVHARVRIFVTRRSNRYLTKHFWDHKSLSEDLNLSRCPTRTKILLDQGTKSVNIVQVNIAVDLATVIHARNAEIVNHTPLCSLRESGKRLETVAPFSKSLGV